MAAVQLPAEADEQQPERIAPERIETTALAADESGLSTETVEAALLAAGRVRAERQEIAKRIMHLAVTGLPVVAVGTDEDDRVVLELANTVQDVIVFKNA